jgi:VanZ family protein
MWGAHVFQLNRFVAKDILINVALYVPLGASAFLLLRRRFRGTSAVAIAIAAGCGLSFTVEFIQRWAPARVPNVRDILTNTTGTAIGIALSGAWASYIRLQNRHERKVDPAAASLLLVMGAWLLFPFFPILGRTALLANIHAFRQSALLQPVRFAFMAAIWLLAGHLLKAVTLRGAVPVLGAATLLIPAQMFIVSRHPTLSDLGGAIFGLLMFAFGTRLQVCAVLLTVVVLVRGLMPVPAGVEPGTFSWVPFGSFLDQDWQTAARTLIEKVLFYGGTLWSLTHAGVDRGIATIALGVLLAGIEIAQIGIPGRTPEITDPVLAALLGMVLLRGNPGARQRETWKR